jgi:hypothetical protein
MSTTERNRKADPKAAHGQTRRDPGRSNAAVASGTAATKQHPFDVPRHSECGFKLEQIIAGWLCTRCRLVFVDVEFEHAGKVMQARWAQP